MTNGICKKKINQLITDAFPNPAQKAGFFFLIFFSLF